MGHILKRHLLRYRSDASNRTEVRGDHWGQQRGREDSEDRIKVQLYRRSWRFVFLSPL